MKQIAILKEYWIATNIHAFAYILPLPDPTSEVYLGMFFSPVHIIF